MRIISGKIGLPWLTKAAAVAYAAKALAKSNKVAPRNAGAKSGPATWVQYWRDVAVKIQYPGIDDIIRADLVKVDSLFSMMGMLFSGMDPKVIIDELKVRLTEELDYTLEADNQRLFADWYRGHPTIHVPEVISEYCTPKVLVTEFAHGARWPACRKSQAGHGD